MGYILKGQKPVVENSLRVWGDWFENHPRRLKRTYFDGGFVSTVFLGLDHNIGSGKPLLFETMIFRDDIIELCSQYHTWKEAVEGHKKAVALICGY